MADEIYSSHYFQSITKRISQYGNGQCKTAYSRESFEAVCFKATEIQIRSNHMVRLGYTRVI